MTEHTRTTLINLGSDELTPDEIIPGWKSSTRSVMQVVPYLGTADENVRSFVVDDICNGNPPNDRKLVGLTPCDWFDIAGATYETSCRLSGKDNDDRRF
jgi:hypothetical protein